MAGSDPFGVRAWVESIWSGRSGNVDLPGWAVIFLHKIGVQWPIIDEDMWWQLAELVREYREAVSYTHQEATGIIANVSAWYQSNSADVMNAGWKNITDTKVTVILERCDALANALDIAGDLTRAQKVDALIDLGEIAAGVALDIAVASVTFGIAAAALPALVEGALLIAQSLVASVVQDIAGHVLGQFAQPLFADLLTIGNGLDWSQSGGTPTTGQQPLMIDPQKVADQAALMSGLPQALSNKVESVLLRMARI